MKSVPVRSLVITAMCIALGVVLPMALHAIPNAGRILLPMHLPILLCGLACGFPFGLACGILAPLLSNLITAMPPAAILPSMICELAAYGVLSGLAGRYIRLPNRVLNCYVQLLSAMLLGRAVYGVANALIFSVGGYTFAAFFTAAFLTALPGIIGQLVLIPPLLMVIERSARASA